MKEQDSKSTDPANRLPPHVLSLLFGLFDNQELAILSAVSKGWRTQIQTDVIIQRVEDLMNENLSEDEAIELVGRNASLSSYPKNEILLGLKPFWESLEEAFESRMGTEPTYEDIMQATSNKYESLMSTIASGTNGMLSSLYLEVLPDHL